MAACGSFLCGACLCLATVFSSGPRADGVRERVDRAVEELRAAMRRHDFVAVEAAADAVRRAWGDRAGVPEHAARFLIPPDFGEGVGREQALSLWRDAWRDGLERNSVPAVHRPDTTHRLLRETAYVVMGGSAGLRHGAGPAEDIRRELDRRTAYLLAVQRPDGLFPFADLRGTDSPFAPILDSHYRRWPEDFVDGFVVEDHEDGGLQFDNGVCAVALVRAYEAGGSPRCLEAARRACEWTLTRPIVVNWNYNAFSVWALACYSRAARDTRFLAPAIERLRLGVLPGQLPSGRWADPHNARTVYHAILLRAMAELYGILPEHESVRPVLKEAIRRADRVLVEEICTRGATDADHSLSALCAVDRAIGPDPSRARAIRAVINAMRVQLTNRTRVMLEDLTLFAVGQMLDRVDR